ncbi:uncharacterized protein TNIN_442831 [Trichonephila inaurata madagascariensis]|uniref:Uncharacterized protein n=1 Tax=Trichonephila inaurata madagascariensis TaxID=2747483 RepID=A0A8X6XUS6_9ARAC|nr:uncharacterized protein TNIN_442831 [Trichonephila inaurata madagascariensis]
MSPPILHDFTKVNELLKSLSRNFEFDISDNWEIPVLNDDDVVWSIVLAYLNSFPPSKNELTRRLDCLIGHQKGNKDFEKFFKNLNPFLHRTACFGDEFIINTVNIFKNQLENSIQRNVDFFLTFLENDDKYLEISTRLLSCNIIVISVLSNEKKLVRVFPQVPPLLLYPKYILLIHRPGGMKYRDSFSFCIPKKVGLPKQKLALIEILEKATISRKVVEKICSLPKICEHFLVTLLKNDYEQEVQLIYKSLYVLSKLSDAGFETDPRKKDIEGKSALHYSLLKDKWDLLFFLYDHAANTCLQTQSSVRIPDPTVVENLLSLKDCLESLEKEIKSPEINENSKYFKKLNELQQFNKFQIEISEEINTVRQTKNCYFEKDEHIEIFQRREIILKILEVYRNYFHFVDDNALSQTKNDLILSQKFYQNRNYFDKLDFCSAVIFFDNLFLLKERLKLVDNAYLEIESKFFLYIFCKRYLENYDKSNEFLKESRWIAFQEQLSLQKQICIFRKFLEETEISEENIITSVSEDEVYTLVNLPEIYGQFLLYRLHNYLDTVAKIKIMNEKSVLIIERSLQVIGESFKESNLKSIQKVLSQALPNEFVSIAKQIRNNLIHFTHFDLLHRNNAETNLKLLEEIKKELIQFRKLLSPITSTHTYQINQFLNSKLLKSLSKARRKEMQNKTGDHQRKISVQPQLQSNEVNNSQNSGLYSLLQRAIKILNQETDFLNKNSINSYGYFIKNLISAVKEELMHSKSETLMMDQDKKKLDHIFWSLECLLIYLTKDRKLKEYRRRLLNGIQDRECLFSGIRRKKHHSQKVKKCLTSNISAISDEKVHIAGQTETVSSIKQCNGTDSKEAQDNTQNEILFEGATDYEYSSIMKGNEKLISTDVFEEDDLALRTYFSCDSNNDEFSSGKEEQDSLDGIFDISALIEANENELNVEDNLNADLTGTRNTVSKKSEHLDLRAEDSKTDSNLRDQTMANNVAIRNEWNLNEIYYISEDEIKDAKIKGNEDISNILIKNSLTVITDYEKIMKDIFEKFKGKTEKEFSYKNIEKYSKILKGWTFLNDVETNGILRSIPEHFRNIPSTKQKITTLLTKENISSDEIGKELDKLPLKDKEKREMIEEIECGVTDHFNFINSLPDYFSDLKIKIEAGEISKKECNLFCEKLTLADDSKTILLKLIRGQTSKVKGNMFEFFRNRIKLLKKILIDENEGIKELWEKAASLRRNRYLHDKLVQIYINDSEVQASVEMLLSDCMNIFNTKDLKELWLKTTKLFNGISLRNVIAHGNPLLESLGILLDPNDLPFELVGKMINLIRDEPVVDCMQQILEKSEYQFPKFMEFMNDDDEQFKDLREKIKECKNWKDYAFLIAR